MKYQMAIFAHPRKWLIRPVSTARMEPVFRYYQYHAQARRFQHGAAHHAAEVARSWHAVAGANQLVDLSRKMLAWSELELNLIRIGQGVGCNAAQDLALNSVAVEVYHNQLQANEQNRSQVQRALEVLICAYPSAEVMASNRLPEATLALPSAGILSAAQPMLPTSPLRIEFYPGVKATSA